MYEYFVRPGSIRVIDGDTLHCCLQLGFHVDTWQTLRFFGIDTPETRGPERKEGLKVKEHVRRLLEGAEVKIQTVKTRKGADKKGKYGRYLAWVKYMGGDGIWHNLNRDLLKEGMAKAVDY